MPAKSRAQQRLMQAAEHGAQFPMARKLRHSMTPQQLHDFSVGSEKGKPQHVAKAMHPTMVQRARLVKEAHAHLKASNPAYSAAPARERMRMTQAHVNRKLGK